MTPYQERLQAALDACRCEHGRLARSCQICELQEEIAELKAHIERWANEDLSIYGVKAKHANHQYGDGSSSGTCTICDAVWPCPTEVAKGFSDDQPTDN